MSSAGTLHKFRIPGYPMTFKWKRNGRKYQVSLPISLFRFQPSALLPFWFYLQIDRRTDD